MTEKSSSDKNSFRTIALASALIGIIGSLFFMFRVSSQQKSLLLLGLFTCWVISPFAGLFFAMMTENKRVYPLRTSINKLVIILSILSLLVYSGVLTLPGAKPAFVYLVIPFVSWLFIVIVFLFSKKLSNKV
ncbi:MAG: hypothetical protein IPJ66_17025 [Bacteroidetes bacterium]|nr:hypothetical protein [Bacteroidota bacterium]MBL0138216.1 hypothetical protein [Bacteroidota bacterium]